MERLATKRRFAGFTAPVHDFAIALIGVHAHIHPLIFWLDNFDRFWNYLAIFGA